MNDADESVEDKAKLKAKHGALNPLVMKREIDRRLRQVFDIRKRYGEPKL